MLCQYLPAEWIDLAKGDGLEAARALQAEAEAANTGKKIQYFELRCAFWYGFRHDQTFEALRLLRITVCAGSRHCEVVLRRLREEVSMAAHEGSA